MKMPSAVAYTAVHFCLLYLPTFDLNGTLISENDFLVWLSNVFFCSPTDHNCLLCCLYYN